LLKKPPLLVVFTDEDADVTSDATAVVLALTVDCIANTSEAAIVATTMTEINAKILIFLFMALVFHLLLSKNRLTINY